MKRDIDASEYDGQKIQRLFVETKADPTNSKKLEELMLACIPYAERQARMTAKKCDIQVESADFDELKSEALNVIFNAVRPKQNEDENDEPKKPIENLIGYLTATFKRRKDKAGALYKYAERIGFKPVSQAVRRESAIRNPDGPTKQGKARTIVCDDCERKSTNFYRVKKHYYCDKCYEDRVRLNEINVPERKIAFGYEDPGSTGTGDVNGAGYKPRSWFDNVMEAAQFREYQRELRCGNQTRWGIEEICAVLLAIKGGPDKLAEAVRNTLLAGCKNRAEEKLVEALVADLKDRSDTLLPCENKAPSQRINYSALADSLGVDRRPIKKQFQAIVARLRSTPHLGSLLWRVKELVEAASPTDKAEPAEKLEKSFLANAQTPTSLTLST